jgi:Carboxypeptidase regulatory-like domain
MTKRVLFALMVVFAACVFLPESAFAQASIAGVVRDSSGAVLPGVTVEAASPALIEKVRSVVTDGGGVYKIIDLRPGSYTVTFTLAGFSTFKRDGLQLTGSFTATVNADMKVGALEETLTVSGQAPVVDVQTVVKERVLQRDVISAVPTGNRDVRQLAFLIPGVVGSNLSNVGGVSLVTDVVSVHDSRAQETMYLMDGMPFHHGGGSGGNRGGILVNDAAVEEISIQVGGNPAEAAFGGFLSNTIPKSGGNAFRGVFQASGANGSMQSDNIDADQAAQNIKANGLKVVWDLDGALGGPLKQDKLWFYTAIRRQEYDQYVTGVYFNATPQALTYTPDTSRPGYSPLYLASNNLRLTYQMTPRNKFTAFYDYQNHCECYAYKIGTSTATPPSPEASYYYQWIPDYMAQAKWTSTISSRLLFELGTSDTNFNYPQYPQRGNDWTTLSLTESTTGFAWRNYANAFGENQNHMYSATSALSYVTGSHAFKVGTLIIHSSDFTSRDATGPHRYTMTLRNGVPQSITEYATPVNYSEVLKANVGIFAQDQWKFRSLTLNYGARFEYYNAYVPAQSAGPAPNVPNRNVSYDPVSHVPLWKNLTPRVGVSYDVFGNGKTAIKGSIGQFVWGPEIITFTRIANPLAATVFSGTRTLVNPTFTPNCDFTNTAANGDCAQLDNVNFGKPNVTQSLDPGVTSTRGTNWEGSASVQHELRQGIAVTGGYYRRWYQNIFGTENVDVTPNDFDSYCVNAPADPRLPNGGGYQVCGLYDVKPTSGKFGVSNNVTKLAPQQTEVFNGVDLDINARFGRGIVASFGTSTGRTKLNDCFKLGHPEFAASSANAPYNEDFCNPPIPFQTQYKAYGVFPLPWYGIRTSATFKSLPGTPLAANVPITTADIAANSTLGRRLAGNRASVTVNVLAPGQMYGDTVNQLDWRASKTFAMGSGRRLALNFDLYNVFNANQNLRYNSTYGSKWLNSTLVIGGRLVKFGGQLDF